MIFKVGDEVRINTKNSKRYQESIENGKHIYNGRTTTIKEINSTRTLSYKLENNNYIWREDELELTNLTKLRILEDSLEEDDE